MALDVQQIAESWKQDEPKYRELGLIVSDFMKSNITEYEILPEISYRTKELLSIVKKIKKKQLQKEYSYSHLNDKLGFRIICTFQEEMQKIDDFLKKYFNIKKVEYKHEALNYDKLDYISNHYDASINISLKPFNKYNHFQEHIFEVQVRTLNQHAWSNTAHSLSYKQEAEISFALQRKVYRLLALYEIADDEFSAVNKALIEHPDNKVYTLLRKLEGKIYKFGKVDYDRESSLNSFKILLTYFSENEKQLIYTDLDGFIKNHEDKIELIFDENKNHYFEIPFLTQPEIFLIWFAIEKFPFSIDDNWANDFDYTELENIKMLWGKVID